MRPSGVSSTCEPPLLHAAARSPAPEMRLASHARRVSDGFGSRACIGFKIKRTRVLRSVVVSNWKSFLIDLECTACGLRHDADRLQTVCTACGKVLFGRYDLEGVRQAVKPSDFAARRWDMWR